MRKLNSILLVDDNEPTNLFHEHSIKKLDCAEEVHTSLNGIEAINWLNERYETDNPMPELIFLDINMPKMNGWEFLEACEEQAFFPLESVVIIMLTTSPNPADMELAKGNPLIADYVNKPLREDGLSEVLGKFF